jgi:genome maintenance exonuclease 1
MTLIVERYKYEKIERTSVEGKRKYLTPDGFAVASVTTILDATKDKTHLHAWRKRVGEQKATEITTEAAGVGTRMHKYLED